MAIIFSCACGKKLQTRNELAGKKLKCPACQALLTVPEAPEAEAAAIRKETAPQIALPPLTDLVPELAEEKPAPPCLPSANPWADRSLEQQATAWQGEDEKQLNQRLEEPLRSRPLLLALILLLFLAGGGMAGWYFLSPEPPAPTVADLDLVPRDAVGFLSVRVAELWDRPAAKDLRRLVGEGLENQIWARFGLEPANIDRLTVAVIELPEIQKPPFGMGGGFPKQGMVGGFPKMGKKGLPQNGFPKKGFPKNGFPKQRPQGKPPGPGIKFKQSGPGFGNQVAVIGDLKILVLVTTRKPYQEDRVFNALVPGAEAVNHQGRIYYCKGSHPLNTLYFLNDRLFALTGSNYIASLLDGVSHARETGPLTPALDLAKEKKHYVSHWRFPDKSRDLLAHLPGKNQLPAEVQPFLHLQGGTLVAHDADKQFELDFRLSFSEPARAGQAGDILQAYLKKGDQELARLPARLGGGLPPQAEAGFKMIQDTLHRIKVETKESEVHIAARLEGANLGVVSALLVPAVQKVRQAAVRTQAQNNLKQIALAMHAYHDRFQSFPPAKVGAGLSWRVALLPFLGEKELYQQFRLNEPWNSLHNQMLLSKMPRVFASTGAPIGVTHFQVMVGPGTPFGGPRPSRLTDFTDGTSQTFLVVEGSKAVPWTKPDDISFQPDQLPTLGGQFPEVFLAAFGDGSVRILPRNLDPMTLKGLITHAGGELVNLPP